MKKILLLSDTHSHLDHHILSHARWADQIWHAGDIGDQKVALALSEIAPLRAVYGNIDNQALRSLYPSRLRFEEEGVNVLMTHIGGYPPRYTPDIRQELFAAPPDLFISGHSHILKVCRDIRYNTMHFNPGAAGIYGWHKVRTMLRFTISEGKIADLELIEIARQ